ncbi:MAG: amidoligase family protein [Xanthomonadales bacterium]|nr:amidoligase family protein [Xanthomonadales bacterium]
MSIKGTQGFKTPPQTRRIEGSTRRVGFELEFSGIGLDVAAEAVAASLGASAVSQTAAERLLESEPLGKFTVELDWSHLKKLAKEQGHGDIEEGWVEQLSQAAASVVPVEVVCPPIPVTNLAVLDPMVEALREAGAVGTDESLVAAYGVHVNPELPSMDATTIQAHIRAFAALQWWLVDRLEVDTTRRLTPYIDLYPEAYMNRVLSRPDADMDEIFDDYLAHNATRNRALDLLPLLAEIDEARVRDAVDDDRIKARPTFHFRLPNCQIERPGWSLDQAWNAWWVVEKLADQPEALDELAGAFADARRIVLGVNRKRWVEKVNTWLGDHGLV